MGRRAASAPPTVAAESGLAFSGGSGSPEQRRAFMGRSGAAVDSLTRITRPNSIGWQWIHVHLGMADQRNSLLDRLGLDESVAL